MMYQNRSAEYLQNPGLNGSTDPKSFKACVPLVTHKDLEPYILHTSLSRHFTWNGLCIPSGLLTVVSQTLPKSIFTPLAYLLASVVLNLNGCS